MLVVFSMDKPYDLQECFFGDTNYPTPIQDQVNDNDRDDHYRNPGVQIDPNISLQPQKRSACLIDHTVVISSAARQRQPEHQSRQAVENKKDKKDQYCTV